MHRQLRQRLEVISSETGDGPSNNAKSKSKEVKTMALRVVLVGQVLVTAMQFYKPSGTGAEGSPATGPIPVIIAMALPVVYANFIA